MNRISSSIPQLSGGRILSLHELPEAKTVFVQDIEAVKVVIEMGVER